MKPQSTNRIKPFLKYIFLTLGAVFLYLLIREVGWNRLVTELKRMRFGFMLYMMIHAIEEAIKTSAWQASFPDKHKFNWWKLYGIGWIGSAVNQIYQAGIFGANTAKVVMVRNEVSAHKGIASVLISTLSDAVALVFFTSIGIVFLLQDRDVSETLKISVFIAFSLLSISILIFWALQWHGRLGSLIGFLQRMPLPESIKTKLREKTNLLDDSIRIYHHSKNRYFWQAVGLNFLRRFLSLAKIQLVLYLLAAPGGFQRCLYISVFSTLVNSFFFFIPSRLGVLEGGMVVISKALGMTTAQGLTLGIVARITGLLWAALGFGLLLMWKERSPYIERGKKEAAL